MAGILAGALALAVWGRSASGAGAVLAVEVAGQPRGTFSLAGHDTLWVQGQLGPSAIEISGGKARILRAPCRQQICTARGWIGLGGELAVCLPNRLVAVVRGNKAHLVDGVTR